MVQQGGVAGEWSEDGSAGPLAADLSVAECRVMALSWQWAAAALEPFVPLSLAKPHAKRL